jgi:hypothetical protein
MGGMPYLSQCYESCCFKKELYNQSISSNKSANIAYLKLEGLRYQ